MAQTIRIKRSSVSGKTLLNAPTHLSGELGFNSTDKKIWLADTDTTQLEILTEEHGAPSVQGIVKNTSGVTIAAGMAIHITGYDNANGLVEVTAADKDSLFANAIALEEIVDDATGQGIMTGKASPLDTTTAGWTEGDILYLGDNGGMVNVKPTSGIIQPIAFVLREHVSLGALQINVGPPQQSAEDVRFDPSTSALVATNVQTALKELSDDLAGSSTLDGLTDTNLGTPVDGQVLTYDNATSKWISDSPAGGLVPTATDFTATQDQVTFTVTYDINSVSVFVGGVKLEDTEYTATSGTFITLDQALEAGTWVQVLATGQVGDFNLYDWTIDQGATNIHPNNLSTTTTANIADSTNKRYVTDLEAIDIDNLSGTNTGDQSSSDFSLGGLSDTTITANTSGEILKWSGSSWVNNTLSEAGIQPSGVYNTVIGIDTNFDSSGAQVIDVITLTDGVIQGITTRDLSYSDIGGAALAGSLTQDFNTDNLTVDGNLTVNGSITNISSTTLQVEDKNIELGYVDGTSETDATADGGGITLQGTTDKTFNWSNTTDSWESSEPIIASTFTGDLVGNADTADNWSSNIILTLGTDLTGNVSFDGSGNVTLNASVVDDSHNHIIGNVDGLQTALDNKVATNSSQALTSAADALTVSGSTLTLTRGDASTDTAQVTLPITELTDVFSSMSPNDGQVLTYDTTNGWQAETPFGESIKDLTDVFSTMVPVEGEVLTYNDTNGWQNVSPTTALNFKTDFLASAGQTVFTVDYDSSNINVFVDGVKLKSSEFIAINGTSVTLPAQDLDTWVQIESNTNVGVDAPSLVRIDLTATASQTVFNVNYTASNVEVYAEGVKLKITEYTASNGTSITFNEAQEAGTWIQVVTNASVPISEYKKQKTVTTSNIALDEGYVFTKTISGATTLTISGTASTGLVHSFILELINPSTNVTWFSGIKWPGGTAPTLTTTGTDILEFYTYDNGTTWRGKVFALDSK